MTEPATYDTRPTIFGREPAVLISAVTSVLALLVAFGLDFLSAQQAGAVEAVLAAAATCWIAAKVRPMAPTLFTGLITAGASLAAAYGFALSQAQVGSITAASVALMTALVIRPQSTPATNPRPIDGTPPAAETAPPALD
ncbi:hypothetical protein EV384_3416 [Micromonospora kangleipakensis]|uniref:Holin n=1 Tax=Micromonospora kangleipakensis TaxID=1077942 RepID=A0A4Q8BCC8_9ACTN|nr:hypothetical protein [Micromonospora kangleipakensis]RZU74921.1 hypothetical protein EV384_3416 [Micromonospora kangleipakensis]